MNIKQKYNSLDPVSWNDIAGIGTWAIVTGLSFYIISKNSITLNVNPIIVALLFIAYLGCFVAITRLKQLSQSSKLTMLGLQLVLCFAILWCLPFNFLSILTIIWAAILPHFFKIKTSLIIVCVVVFTWFYFSAIHWQQSNIVISGLLFFSFHIFAIMMMHHANQAEASKLQTEKLNQELLTAQTLLEQATKQNERTRIARDLHDLLGHHLTALIINLQVAAKLSNGEAQQKIVQCHDLSKLLLSDVREAVSNLRENHHLDLAKMIDLITQQLPNLSIDCNIDSKLNLDQLPLAKTILHCTQEAITNALKHDRQPQAEKNVRLSVTLKHHQNQNQNQNKNKSQSQLQLQLINQKNPVNHQHNKTIKLGNGLKGMQERVKNHQGKIEFCHNAETFSINIIFPYAADPINKMAIT